MQSNMPTIAQKLTIKKMDADLIELLTQNLSRFDEGSDADRAGVYYVLGESSFPSPTNVTTILM